jgi:hypothetical protein
MGPEFDGVFRTDVVGMAHAGDIRMQCLQLGLRKVKDENAVPIKLACATNLGMLGAHRHGLSDLSTRSYRGKGEEGRRIPPCIQ